MDGQIFLLEGTDPPTGVNRYHDAYAESFSKELCITAWETVGAVPYTWDCLKNKKFWRLLGDGGSGNVMKIAMVEMQTANTMMCYLLTAHGFNCH